MISDLRQSHGFSSSTQSQRSWSTLLLLLLSYLTQVSLLPSVLARKRVWNRKYPICLVLAEGVQVEEEVEGEDEVLLPGSEEKEEEERAAERQALPESHAPDTLYLFGRTGREKEEWFQHFLSASRDSRLYGSPSREESKVGRWMRCCCWRWWGHAGGN